MERLVQITPPAAEPLALELVKGHCRVQHSLEDALLRTWIKAAREYAEHETSRQLITATWRLTRGSFPARSLSQDYLNRPYEWRHISENEWCQRIEIPITPVQSILSFGYYDNAGVLQALTSDDYQFDGNEASALLLPAPQQTWPATQPGKVNAVQISILAGHGDTDASTPGLFQQAMLLMIGEWYLKREELASVIKPDMPTAAQRLLAKVASMRYA
jgi:uncharacterized phiE125 gp8 family phage protein